MTTAPHGSWASPFSAELVAGGKLRLDSLQADGEDLYWLEGRPSNRGRYTLVRNGADVTPPDFNVRTHAHEYGGGAYVVHNRTAYLSNFDDGRLYRLTPGGQPQPVTPPDGAAYADMRIAPDGFLICVRELNGQNEIVAVDAGGSVMTLASGADFYSNPRISPDGKRLAYLSWNLPNMPWDGTDLWVANLDGSQPEHVAGGPGESVFQPEWSPDGILHYVSDRT
ncbi:MAG TPA: S9 family peptidase, partial [Chloroflexota bacterium]|nr:S9 family peptidase [Chloroflexota bacterium]